MNGRYLLGGAGDLVVSGRGFEAGAGSFVLPSDVFAAFAAVAASTVDFDVVLLPVGAVFAAAAGGGGVLALSVSSDALVGHGASWYATLPSAPVHLYNAA